MRLHALTAGFLTLLVSMSCGAPQPREAQPAVDGTSPQREPAGCKAGDVADCVSRARAQCEASRATVWEVHSDGFPDLVVAPPLVRARYLGSTIYSVDGQHWLACVEQCPESSSPQPSCFPLHAPISMMLRYDATCRVQDRADEPWQEQLARQLVVDCGAAPSSIRYVPAYEAVARALVETGVIAADSPLARLGGLPVAMVSEGAPVFEVTEVTPASCDAFALPPSATIVSSPAAHRELGELYPRFRARADAAAAALTETRLGEAEDALLAQASSDLAERCAGAGLAASSEAELQRCLRTQPDIRGWIANLLADRLAQARRGLSDELTELRRREYLGPLCRHFSTP